MSPPLPSPLPSDPFICAALGAFALLLTLLVVFRRRRPWLSHLRRKSLLTANEAEFFRRLTRALPAHAVFPQVSFAALITDDGRLSPKRRWSVRARFDRKIADFVICDRRTLEIVALVELDDRTHEARGDRQRDALTRAAGYQTLRFQSKRKPTEAEIAELFRHAEAWTSKTMMHFYIFAIALHLCMCRLVEVCYNFTIAGG